jgi:hypothetical protein
MKKFRSKIWMIAIRLPLIIKMVKKRIRKKKDKKEKKEKKEKKDKKEKKEKKENSDIEIDDEVSDPEEDITIESRRICK